MQYEADYFVEYFYLVDITEEQYDRIVTTYQALYQNASYTIHDANRADDDFTIKVTIKPMLSIEELLNVALLEAEKEGFEDMSDEDYNELIIKLFEDQVANNPVNYGPEVEVVVSVTQDADGIYGITQDSINSVDQYVIAY